MHPISPIKFSAESELWNPWNGPDFRNGISAAFALPLDVSSGDKNADIDEKEPDESPQPLLLNEAASIRAPIPFCNHEYPVNVRAQAQLLPIVHKWLGVSSSRWQTWLIHFYSCNKPTYSTSLKLASWSLTNWSYEQGPFTYNRNPFNQVESLEEYYSRKRNQINEIQALMLGTEYNGIQISKVNIISLQEIDFISYGERTEFAMERYDIKPKPHEMIYLTLYHIFKKTLSDCKWNIIITNPSVSASLQIPFCIIYNTLELSPKYPPERFKYLRGIFPKITPVNGNYKFCAGQVLFTKVQCIREFAITTACFPPSINPEVYIEPYQETKISQDTPTIIVGNFNKTCNDLNFVLPVQQATTLNTLKVKEPCTKLSNKDEHNKKKTYHSLCVSPSFKGDVSVAITEGTYFKRNPKNHSIEILFSNLAEVYHNKTGHPWKK